jgi:peptidoglycan/LPS O-acetylase OafA/YrhL
MSISLSLAQPRQSTARGFFDLELLDNRYPVLHGMRVLGIISVVQYHVTMVFTFQQKLAMDWFWAATSLAVFFGMDLFFILSGFLIGSILLHSVEHSGSQQVRRFYLRRAFRTFPPYYVVLTILVFTTSLSSSQRHHLWLEYLYLTNYGRPLAIRGLVMPWGWSLALEEQFYLAVPLLFVVLLRVRSDRGRVGLLAALWASAFVVRLVLHLRHPDWDEESLYNFLYYKTHARYDTLVAGIFLAYVQSRWREPIGRWLERPAARAIVAVPSLLCLWLLMNQWVFGWGGAPLAHVLSWGTLTTIMYAGWILLLLNDRGGWIQRALSLPVFRRMATLGYGVYLVHLPLCTGVMSPAAHALTERFGWPMFLVWPLAVVALFGLSMAVSYVLHLSIEKPALRLRDRLAA